MSVILNLYANPNAFLKLDNWGCSYQKNSEGKYVYTGSTDVWAAIMHGITPQRVVVVSFETSSRDNFKLENCREIYKSSTTLAGIYSGIDNCSLYCTKGKGVSATVNRIGMYTQDDWNRLRQYGLEWFDGDTMPRA